jgi:hypothetical protein
MIDFKKNWAVIERLSTRDNFIRFLAAVLALHMFSFPLALYHTLIDTGPTWLGLDPSWQMTLNYAHIKGSTWGTDVIFSYGPLGFLATRVGWGISRWTFLLFDLFVVVNFFFVFKDFIKNAIDKFLAILILFCIILLMRSYYGTDLSWALLFLTFYWMYKTFLNPRLLYFVIIGVLITLSFYIKLNTAFVGILFFIAHLVNLLVSKKIRYLKAMTAFSVMAGFILLLSFLLHVSLVNYIKGSLEIIKGYNYVMYLEQDQKRTETALKVLYWCLVILYLLYSFFLLRTKKYSELFFTAICIGYVFLLKKQSVLRNDIQHLSEFFAYAPLVLICGNLFSLNERLQKIFLASVTLLSFSALLLTTERRPADIALRERFGKKKEYLQQFSDYNSRPYLHQKDKRFIPPEVLGKIGNHTIDIFPWDGEYLLENHLNYTPRPIFQSYSAYTEYLQNRNYDFYVHKAPEFVIYDYDAIDGRYPFNEECLVNFFLAKNYFVADTFTSNERWRILLQKKKETAPLSLEKVKEESVSIQNEITVSGISFIKIALRHNLRGKLRSFKYKPPPVYILFMKPGGEWLSFKTSGELLKAGIMVEKLVMSSKDFVNFISQKDSLGSVNKVKLQLDPKYFSHEMKVQYFKIAD